jgi:hypothetical protein
MTQSQEQYECCPPFDPTPWDGKLFEWENKMFIRDKVFTLFYFPINFGKVIIRLMTKMQAAGAESPGWLCLSDHKSRWRMDLYLAVDKNVPEAENVSLSGKFLCKTYEGPYKDTAKWCADFKTFAMKKGFSIDKWFMWYTTCPKCSKKYGKNYVTIVAQVSENS